MRELALVSDNVDPFELSNPERAGSLHHALLCNEREQSQALYVRSALFTFYVLTEDLHAITRHEESLSAFDQLLQPVLVRLKRIAELPLLSDGTHVDQVDVIPVCKGRTRVQIRIYHFAGLAASFERTCNVFDISQVSVKVRDFREQNFYRHACSFPPKASQRSVMIFLQSSTTPKPSTIPQ